MKYYKYFYWAYLLLAVIFAVDGILELVNESETSSPYVKFFFAAMALFMFFFRKRTIAKMEERMKNR